MRRTTTRASPAHWPARLAGMLVVGAMLALIWVLAGAGLSSFTSGVPARTEILDVVTDGSLRRHAVVVRHADADTGRTMTGVWIVEGDPPDRDSATRPTGRPAAIWSEGVVRLGWQADRLLLIGDQRRVRETCEREDSPPAAAREPWLLCLDTTRARFVPLPR